MFYRSQTAPEQAHTASAFAFELGKVDAAHVRMRTLSHFINIDPDLANRVATALGMQLPEAAYAAIPIQDLATSNALQTIGLSPKSLRGRFCHTTG